MLIHKRGVENVILFQSDGSPFKYNYYLHWDTQTRVMRFGDLICIGIKKNIFWSFTLNFVLRKIRIRNNFLFIHSHNPLMSLVCWYQTNLFTVHDALYYLLKSTEHKLYRLFWFLEKLLYFRCNYVHFISVFAKKMSLFEKRNNYVIISNTSHLENSKTLELGFDDNLSKYSSDVLKVFIVRSIEERARVDLIVKVAEELKNEKIEFLIAGKGPLLLDYRKIVADLGLTNITLLGYVPDKDLVYYYNECDLVMVTAQFGEGFGLPIIEGYLFNKPVVASNVCAIPEIIISKEFLFENTVQSIIERLYFAFKKNDLNFRVYYDQYFSNERIIFDFEELYKKLY